MYEYTVHSEVLMRILAETLEYLMLSVLRYNGCNTWGGVPACALESSSISVYSNRMQAKKIITILTFV